MVVKTLPRVSLRTAQMLKLSALLRTVWTVFASNSIWTLKRRLHVTYRTVRPSVDPKTVTSIPPFGSKGGMLCLTRLKTKEAYMHIPIHKAKLKTMCC